VAATMSAALESFTGGVATAVDVAGIERQLAALWQMAAESETAAVTRASMGNLVVVCETEAGQEHVTDVIRTLTSRHPCRAVVLRAQPSAADELTASITAHCHLAGGGGKQVCCEQITIQAGGQGVRQLAGAVLPLLESDLPTFVWWAYEFLAHADLFERFTAVADRIFFDTSTWPDAEPKLPAVLATLRRHPRRTFGDLSWTRLGLWRALTADLFESAECRAELATLHAVAIEHGGGPGARLRARLYAGWLAAQLGRPLQVELRSGGAATAGILQVTLRSESGRFVLQKNPDEQTACSTVHLPALCELPRTRAFWPTDDASLLSQELDSGSRHAAYERALAAVVGG